MNNTGNRIILLLVVGLAAFSSAMKELNQLQQFSVDTSSLIAQWSPKTVQSEVPQVVVKVESLDNTIDLDLEQSIPSVELPWLDHDTCDAELKELSSPRRAAVVETRKIERTAIRRPRPVEFGPSESQIAKLKRLSEIDIDPVKFEVRVSTDQAEPDSFVFTEMPAVVHKARARKNNVIRLNLRDREMILKTLNRTNNLRSAG